MDNANLNELSANAKGRQFWVKQWGDPDKSEDFELQSTTELRIGIDFSQKPSSIQIGDILIIHRIKHAKVMLVAEVTSEPIKATSEDIKKEYWREKWNWRIETKNLTPIFGSQWKEQSLKTFALAKEFNEATQTEIKLGRLNFGKHVRVSEDFAKFIFKEIMRVDDINS